MDAWQKQVYDKLVKAIEISSVDSEESPRAFTFNSKEVYIIKRVFEEQFVFLKKPGKLPPPPPPPPDNEFLKEGDLESRTKTKPDLSRPSVFGDGR